MRKCTLANKKALLAAMAKTAKLYVPVDGADEKSKLAGAYYAEWKDGTQLSKKLNTTRSPKDFFFPQTENMMTFKMTGKKLEIFGASRREEIAKTYDIPRTAALPIDKKLAGGVDKGMIELFNGDWLNELADAIFELQPREHK